MRVGNEAVEASLRRRHAENAHQRGLVSGGILAGCLADGRRIAFEGSTVLARDDYAMRWNMGLPGGLTVLGPTLMVGLQVQAVRRGD